ncbi:MAG: penicillin-binding protein activator [Candidatus Paceibacterota bacterium]|jgi:branched-chain amino acid transport system substrate-binding protein
MKKYLYVIIILIIIVAITLCFWFQNSKSVPKEEDIKIGVIAPLTGPVADYGEEIRKGVIDGLGSSTIKVIFEDDKCDPKEAVSAFKKLTEFQNIKLVIGPACGGPQEAIVPLLKSQNVLAIVPAAASADLFAQSGDNFLNTQYSLEEESKFIADKIFERGLKKVALVSYGNAFSKTHADSFRANFKGKIVTDEVINDVNADVAPIITKIKAAKADAIYAPDVSWFFANGVPKLKQQQVNAPVFGTYVVELPAIRKLVPGVIYSFPGDLPEGESAVYGLSKQATQLLVAQIKVCNYDYGCIKKGLLNSGKFKSDGTYQRPLILKQIQNDTPIILP